MATETSYPNHSEHRTDPNQTECSTREQASYPLEILAPLEAILMIIDRPVSVDELTEALSDDFAELDNSQVEKALQSLAAEYAGKEEKQGAVSPRPHGFRLRYLAGGWRIYSAPEYAPQVGKFLVGGQRARLSQAALETLAVIAYRQPVTRSGVAQVRGVNVDGVVRTLLAHNLIETAGETASGATLYQTTTEFLERIGLESIDQLPPVAPLLPGVGELDQLAQQLKA